MANNKLELTWLDKDKPIKVEPRLLIENPELSNIPTKQSFNSRQIYDNLLIHGDNLIALKSLESKFAGKIKCIYIDPPYNTGNAFEHYDDGVEHSIWLSMMYPRMRILKSLLSDDGLLFVQIDDNELAYLTVLLDEVFGRNNRVNILTVKMSESSGVKMAHVEKRLPKIKEFILIYKKTDKSVITPIKIPKQNIDDYLKYYNQMIIDLNEPVEKWRIISVVDYMKSQGYSVKDENIKQFKLENASRVIYRTNNASFKDYKIDKPLTKIISKTGIEYIWWEGKQMLFLADYISEYACDLWTDISTINLNKEGVVDFKQSKKPEKLIERILELSTKKADIVLDSFLGSGTTAAVAHKMGRKWIGIELGDHAYTHSKVRLDKVIEGEQGGISKAVNWKGGGGYRFYELAPTLIKVDSFGQAVINPEYNADMLAAAVALHEGYDYNPDQDIFWKQAKNGDFSYLFTTTRHLDRNFIDSVASQMAENEFLVISCKSFDSLVSNLHKNIVIKKIPQSLLKNCEFHKENYNLNIINPPVYEEEGDDEDE